MTTPEQDEEKEQLQGEFRYCPFDENYTSKVALKDIERDHLKKVWATCSGSENQ